MRTIRKSIARTGLILIFILIAISSGCKGISQDNADPTVTSSLPVTAGPTYTQPLPTATATPVPLALRVNGEGIPLAEFEAQLIQIQAADAELGVEWTAEEQIRRALDELIDQTLLAQAAVKGGFELNDAELDARIEQLIGEKGSISAYNDWLVKNGYTELSFRFALARSIRAAWQRDQILAEVPDQIEQIRARQVLVRSRETAERLLANLAAGGNFSTLAHQYDPLTGGDLGWFPHGYLTQVAVEEAAFNLQPGEVSGIIETDFGFHIIQVLERDTQHPLSPEARLVLQQKALDDWLADQRTTAVVEILIP